MWIKSIKVDILTDEKINDSFDPFFIILEIYAKFQKTYGNFSLFMRLIDNLPFFGAAIFFSHVIRTNLILTAKQLGLSKNRQSVPLKIPKKKFHFSMFVSQTQDK